MTAESGRGARDVTPVREEKGMKIKRFVAPDMRSAIREVRDEQGPDAVILSNRRVEGGVEIIAAVDYDEALVNHALGSGPAVTGPARRKPDASGPAAGGEAPPNPGVRQYADAGASDENATIADCENERDWVRAPVGDAGRAGDLEPARSREAPAPPAGDPSRGTADASRIVWSQEPNLMQMRRELNSVRSLIENQFSSLAWDRMSRERPVKAGILRELSEMGLEPDLARTILTEMPPVQDSQQAWRMPLGMLARRIPVGEDRLLEKGGCCALVGPTGVGKTTTIAKLAARFALRHGKRHVALISADQYRVGGADQLHSYGRILGVPVYSVSSEQDLRESLEELENKKLVLIDTAGMSQRDSRLPAQLEMLRAKHPRPVQVHLVLAADTPAPTQEETVKAYSSVAPDGLMLTKLDEATSIGGGISVAVRHGLPVEYMADGQRVPEDLQPARAHRLVSRAVQLHRQWPARVDETELATRFGAVAADNLG